VTLKRFQLAQTFRDLEFTRAEVHDLVLATERQCECSFDEGGRRAVATECAAHLGLQDRGALKHLLFARRLVQRWRMGEFGTAPRAAA
jgi:hypothetical protein